MSNSNPLIVSMDIIYNGEPVKILNPKVVSPGVLEAFIHPLLEDSALESGTSLFSTDDLSLPKYQELDVSCKNASKNIFLALFVRANSMKESMLNGIDELNTAFIITNGVIVDSINSEASNGYDDYFMYSFNKMKDMKADWGIFTEFGTDNKTGEKGIFIEVGHPDFGKIFISNVSFNEKLNAINVNTFKTRLIQEGAGAKWK